VSKEKRFDLGAKGLNVVATPIHLEDGALVLAQNAQKSTTGEAGGIGKRMGQELFKDTGASAVIAFLNVALLPDPLTDPDTGTDYELGDENPMRCKLYKSASQVILNNTLTALTYDSEEFDVGALHSNVTLNSRITVPTGGDGIWIVVATASWEGRGATGGRTGSYIYKNGGTRIAIAEETPPVATGDGNLGTTYSCISILPLTAGDYLEHFVQQNSGTDLDALGAAVDLCSFSAVRLFAS
jgi:hypothetical protein